MDCAMEQKINSIILAGGENTRMGGEDKAFLKLGGRTVIRGIIEKLRRVSGKIIIVTNNSEKYEKIARNDTGVKIKLVLDDYPGSGPLAGIYSGLKASNCKYNFITACDMPFPDAGLIKYMTTEAAAGSFDICVPNIGVRFHPLCGIYSKECLPVIKKNLEEGKRGVRSIFAKARCRFLSKRQVQEFDKNLFCLTNINTQDDLFRVENYFLN